MVKLPYLHTVCTPVFLLQYSVPGTQLAHDKYYTGNMEKNKFVYIKKKGRLINSSDIKICLKTNLIVMN